jgi:hypothetical protein
MMDRYIHYLEQPDPVRQVNNRGQGAARW